MSGMRTVAELMSISARTAPKAVGKDFVIVEIISAVKTASMLNVDNRIMYRIGVVARETWLVNADFAMGIPLSATGKSLYFDR